MVERATLTPGEVIPLASKRRLRKKQCSRKISYESQDEARLMLRRIKKRLFDMGLIQGPIHTYQCCWCGKWHIGHVPWRTRISQAMRRRRVYV